MAVSRINEAGLNVNQYGNRNVIINGAMMLAQRQTSSSNVGNKYVLDRFAVYKQNTGSTYTCSRNSVTDLAGFNNSLKMDCTTADTSLASNEQVYISYKAEGQDLQGFEKGFSTAKGFTLSFYVKTNKTGLYTVGMFDRDNTRKVNGSYTVADTSWNRYTINFPADTTGKFDDDNASSLEIFFNLVAGSDTNTGTLYTTWQASVDAGSATGQVNFADSTSNDWEITGVQLEVGDTATDFEHRSFGDELVRCQRYYEKSFSQGTDPAVGVSGDGANNDIGSIAYASNNTRTPSVRYSVTKRAAPTVTQYHPGGYGTHGTNNKPAVYIGGAWSSPSSVSVQSQESYFFLDVTITGASAGTGYLTALGWTADAEL